MFYYGNNSNFDSLLSLEHKNVNPTLCLTA